MSLKLYILTHMKNDEYKKQAMERGVPYYKLWYQ